MRRRQDLIGTPRESFVYDDFAHHPTAVHETLARCAAGTPTGKLFAVFEPRSATACRRMHQDEYTRAFDARTRCCSRRSAARTCRPKKRSTSARLASDLNARGKAAQALPSVDAILDYLALNVTPGSVVALLSNGAFGGIHAKLLERLSR